MREGKGLRTLLAALLVLLLALGLTACGSDDSSSSTAAEAGGQSAGKSSGGASKQDGTTRGADEGKSGSAGKGASAGEGKSSSGGGDASDFAPKHHNDSGGGSQQFQVKGGDNSVQEFGGEADTSERDAAAVALHNFLDARAEGNWAAACEYMSATVIKSFEELASKAKQVEDTSCGGILEKLANPAARQSLKEEAAKANVGSLRIEGERAFVIYTSLDGVILAMPMANEGGVWKVASLAGTPLN